MLHTRFNKQVKYLGEAVVSYGVNSVKQLQFPIVDFQ